MSATERTRWRSPTLLQAQGFAGTLTVLAAFLSAAVSGELGAVYCALFLGALSLATWARGRYAHQHPAIWTALLFGALVVLAVQVSTGALDVVLGAARFALLLCAHRLWNRQSERDELLLLLLSLLLVCVGAALSAELLFGVAFIAYAIAGTWALALTHLRWQIEGSRALGGPALLQSRRLISPQLLASLAGLSLLALAGAAALFFVFPRVTLGGMHRLAHPQAVAGLTDSIELGGHGVIADDPRIALRARILPRAGEVVAPSLHWRARALEVWTGRGWRARPGPITDDPSHRPDLPRRAPGSAAKVSWQTTEIELLAPFNEGVLLAPEGLAASVRFPEPLSARASTRQAMLSADGALLVQPVETGDLTYLVTSARVAIPEEERVVSARSQTPLPRRVALDAEAPLDLDPRVRALGEKLVKDKDPRAAAQAVLDYLGDGFRYTRELDDTSADPIADFLFRRRAGHCELFSSAMVLLLRAGGVPARNVTGFYGGVATASGYLAVRAGDAHSWVEVWERGAGWTLWDPTPEAERGSHQEGLWARMVLLWDGLESKWRTTIVEFDLLTQARALSAALHALQEAGQQLAGRGGSATSRKAAPVLLGLAALVGAVVLAVRSWRRRERGQARAIRALAVDELRARNLWRGARALLEKSGIAVSASLPPREAARQVRTQLPDAGPALDRLVAHHGAARWGGAALSPNHARALLASLRRALRASRRAAE